MTSLCFRCSFLSESSQASASLLRIQFRSLRYVCRITVSFELGVGSFMTLRGRIDPMIAVVLGFFGCPFSKGKIRCQAYASDVAFFQKALRRALHFFEFNFVPSATFAESPYLLNGGWQFQFLLCLSCLSLLPHRISDKEWDGRNDSECSEK